MTSVVEGMTLADEEWHQVMKVWFILSCLKFVLLQTLCRSRAVWCERKAW